MSKHGFPFDLIKKGLKYNLVNGVPVFASLNDYQETEAKAWEDEWKRSISKSSQAAYRMNMRVFRKLGFWEESGEAARFIPADNSMVVLDLGCGNGLSTANLRGKVVVGVDLSTSQMVKAKKRWPKKSFAVGDAQKLPFKSGKFDLVVAINVLHHVPKPAQVLEEARRVLKEGGTLLTVDPNLTNPIGFIGRGLFKLLGLKTLFPTFPQFALGEEERQFTKKQYNNLYMKSRFKKFRIIPHRIERLLFFSTILIPSLSKIPFYESMLVFVSRIGNSFVKFPPFDNLCYFWIGEAIKT